MSYNNSLISRLEQFISINLNKSDISVTIADTIIKNLDIIQDLSISELANKSYTSPASITRFAKKMGYKGFKEFIFALINEKNITYSLEDESSYDSSNFNKKLVDYKSNIIDSINTIHDINAKQFDSICDEIIKADEVCFFGIGTNADILKIFNRELMILGINTKYFNDYDDQIWMSENLKPSSCAFIFSFSMIGSVIEQIHKNIIKSNCHTIIATHNEVVKNGSGKTSFIRVPKNESSFHDEHSKATFAYLYLILGIISVLKTKIFLNNKEV